MRTSAQQGSFRLVAHRGDAKTLLAFDITDEAARKNLAGFSIRVTAKGVKPYYLLNSLRFEHPEQHARVDGEDDRSSANAPFHKFRWVHIPGSFHQGTTPVWDDYLYEVTPRYFGADGRLAALDPGLTASVTIQVAPFEAGAVKLGFTRGFTQSQAFTHHFGKDAKLSPSGTDLQWDTSKQCGISPETGKPFTYADQYVWSGFTARQRVFEVLDEAVGNADLSLDMFAYDLKEPDVIKALLTLAAEGRARIILDSSDEHHDATNPTPEDDFEAAFAKLAARNSAIIRGRFSRYSHDKVMILRDGGGARKVLTGSTNFSITGMYVNSNHVLVFDDATVAGFYADVFDESWRDGAHTPAFRDSKYSKQDFNIGAGEVATGTISFSPHDNARSLEVLGRIVDSVNGQKKDDGLGNVLFAVMELGSTTNNPVYKCLDEIHADKSVFSFGISDNPDGISLYDVDSTAGVLVTGKPKDPILPPPFDEVRTIKGHGHQVHHKFVVCGFDTEGLVFCGSSNLSVGGENANGDNLLMIQDVDIATVFAIEALDLVDHFSFLDRLDNAPAVAAGAPPASKHSAPADLSEAAEKGGWFLSTDDGWAAKFFDPENMHYRDRQIFSR